MVCHIIASFWKDFADIKVSQTLRTRHPHTSTPPQSPDVLFHESRGGFNASRVKIFLDIRHKEPCRTINTQEQSHASGLNSSPCLFVCVWRQQLTSTFWHMNVCKIWLTFVSPTDGTGWERCDFRPGITLTPVLKRTMWHPEVWIYQNGIENRIKSGRTRKHKLMK